MGLSSLWPLSSIEMYFSLVPSMDAALTWLTFAARLAATSSEASSSRSSRDGGRHYGLGLHAASEAASAHGGSVSLANSPSGGAVATIAVPL